ncbi:BRCA2-interacting transcriptional repressor EMSY-like isoform X2 [Argiope bruennichi]|uniref:BRCA2-interacting transcriptional repressor EMSY-like isoform X2 n=1 Tax=Argiope bruennichi TaxID=94029 RepID=UPI002493FBF5|nr:BRCA2-interacting transcriptional repressor EMSY-like isoform X2 [Argiope bruennichi]
MWPMFVDYSDEECKKILRSLELEAYASIVTAFRAQGNLTRDRKKMLLDLCSALSISMERHRAEIRRAVNDEHLNTIAERLFGPNTATEWAIEGRRVVPLVNRLAPQTVFTEIASSAAAAQAVKNSSLPLPGKTGSREMINGMETMASRKRKEYPPDSSVSPQKMSALDSQYFHNFHSFESSSSGISEPMQLSEVSMSSESFPVPESAPQTSSFPDFNAQRNVPPLTTHPMPTVSTAKSPSKHSNTKSSSTVTTFSSPDQMTSNLLTSKNVPQTSAPSVAHEEQLLVSPEVSKSPNDGKNAQRPLSSISSMKSSTIVIPTTVPSTCSASSSSKDRLSASSSSHSKFLSQIRSKPPGHTRQNLPAGLGIKLTSQPPMSQRATVSPKSPSMKVKQDNANIFSKKTSASVFPSSTTDNQPPQLPITTTSESLTIAKSPVSVPKPSPKSDSQTVINQQSTSKQTTTAKNLPKTTAIATTTTSTSTVTTTSHSSQYISRPLFPTSTKSGAKNLQPVIFNVSSTTCTPLQNTVKQAGQIQSEVIKSSPQILPKTTPVGLSSSHLKLGTSTTQTIQYRNDGGLVRSARIVNLSQPVGSRLPCAISSSAISALGLSSNISSTALRVTLPAGTLNTTNSIRVSSAAKPNVIVVHKAQMWPRPPQGAAVIMSSGPLTKLPTEIVETIAITPKSDKNKSSGIKTIPRAIAPARPQSPAVAITSLKASESTPVSNSSTVITSLPDSSTSDVRNSKPAENINDGQCRKNLLAEVIEVSGILESNPADKNSKEKSEVVKNNKEASNLSNHQEPEITVCQKNAGTSANDTNSTRLTESNTPKTDTTSNKAGDSALSVSQSDINGKETSKQTSLPTEVQSKETGSTVISSTHSVNETVTSSNECGSKPQKETTKDKDL